MQQANPVLYPTQITWQQKGLNWLSGMIFPKSDDLFETCQPFLAQCSNKKVGRFEILTERCSLK